MVILSFLSSYKRGPGIISTTTVTMVRKDGVKPYQYSNSGKRLDVMCRPRVSSPDVTHLNGVNHAKIVQ